MPAYLYRATKISRLGSHSRPRADRCSAHQPLWILTRLSHPLVSLRLTRLPRRGKTRLEAKQSLEQHGPQHAIIVCKVLLLQSPASTCSCTSSPFLSHPRRACECRSASVLKPITAEDNHPHSCILRCSGPLVCHHLAAVWSPLRAAPAARDSSVTLRLLRPPDLLPRGTASPARGCPLAEYAASRCPRLTWRRPQITIHETQRRGEFDLDSREQYPSRLVSCPSFRSGRVELCSWCRVRSDLLKRTHGEVRPRREPQELQAQQEGPSQRTSRRARGARFLPHSSRRRARVTSPKEEI